MGVQSLSHGAHPVPRSRGGRSWLVVVTVKSLTPKEITAFQTAGVKAVLAKHDNGAKRSENAMTWD